MSRSSSSSSSTMSKEDRKLKRDMVKRQMAISNLARVFSLMCGHSETTVLRKKIKPLELGAARCGMP